MSAPLEADFKRRLGIVLSGGSYERAEAGFAGFAPRRFSLFASARPYIGERK